MTDLTRIERIPEEIHLIRHGAPVPMEGPRSAWPLDQTRIGDILLMRQLINLPANAVWLVSPETRAVQTARKLVDSQPVVLDELREQVRPPGLVADFETVVRRGLEDPSRSAAEGWETVDSVRSRMERVTSSLPGAAAVVVGHGLALTLLVSVLTDKPPDFEAWQSMRLPDHSVIVRGAIGRPWGHWVLTD